MNDSGTDSRAGERDHADGRTRWARRVLVLSTAVVLQACGGDATAPAPVTLSGNVVLMDAWANFIDDLSGVVVTVDGLSAQAVTDKAGAWRIDGVPTGRHDVRFTKATFGDMRIPALDVTGPTMTTPLVTLTVPPWEQAIIDSIHIGTRLGTDYYFVDGHLSAPPPTNARAGVTVVFLAKTTAVSPDVSSFVQWYSSVDQTGKSQTFSVALPLASIRSTFAIGNAFATAYVVSAACGCYSDPATHKPIYTSIGPRANVVPLTVQ